MEEKRTDRLLRKAQKGNQKALSKLLKSRYEKMYGIAYSYLKNQEDALDVIQEATIRVVNKINQLDEAAYFDTWLVRILINECSRLLAKRQLIQNNQISKDDLSYLSDQRVRINQHIENSELLGYLNQLDHKYEEVILLYYYNDLAVNEIADLLETSVNTVKTRLVRARKALKELLEKEHFNLS